MIVDEQEGLDRALIEIDEHVGQEGDFVIPGNDYGIPGFIGPLFDFLTVGAEKPDDRSVVYTVFKALI